MTDEVSHLIFDVESVADGELIASVRYAGDKLTADEAIERYQQELWEQKGSTFIPHTYQVPAAVVIAKVSPDFRLLDLVSLDEPAFRGHVITEHFWRGWEAYRQPQWVTFNGRTFDLPLMELAAYRYGISLPKWFGVEGQRSPRYRFNGRAHLDLQELLTNFGAARFNGGLNLAAQMLGKPGKCGLTGDQVQQQFSEGNLQAISDYCRCDVLDTYFVFLRCMLLAGRLDRAGEAALIEETKCWIGDRVDQSQAYADYLANWGDWRDPWRQPAAEPADETGASGETSPATVS